MRSREAEHEYRRLLYVAMTRAADRLIICGADGMRARPKGCWYDLIREALDSFLVAEGADEEKVLRYVKPQAGIVQEPAPSVADLAKPDQPRTSVLAARAGTGGSTAAIADLAILGI